MLTNNCALDVNIFFQLKNKKKIKKFPMLSIAQCDVRADALINKLKFCFHSFE